MSIKITDFKTDVYGRFATLKQELVKAAGYASISEDNTEALVAVLDAVAESMGRNVVKMPTKRGITKATKKSN